ncbi:hypothetical protein F2P81_023547 [Scophthalmus maximus]|uniref:Interleukin-6 n=1 Tax=Scophthalmus maximus TaxID=52904 RepID=A0A6A4RXA5_SCOMX|nr:hypothetical protein F2P81_023547 [Scophthalmus maximus]
MHSQLNIEECLWQTERRHNSSHSDSPRPWTQEKRQRKGEKGEGRKEQSNAEMKTQREGEDEEWRISRPGSIGKSLKSQEYKMTAHGKDEATPSGPPRDFAVSGKSTSGSQQRNMPFKLYADVLSAVMLAALLLRALGAPVEGEPTDSPAGDSSGEEELVPSDLLSASPVWDLIIGATAGHQKEEACLRRLAEGLHTYMVLLEHVEREYPGSSILLHAKYYSRQLVDLIKKKMKSPGQVTVLTSSQEEQLVQDINNPDSFHRRMTGHSILQQLHDFLREAKLAIRKREKSRQMRKGSNMIIAAIHPSFQILQR